MSVNLQKAEFVRSAAKAGDFPRDRLPQVAFAGRSNVGKSSVALSTWWISPAMATPRCPRRRKPAGVA